LEPYALASSLYAIIISRDTTLILLQIHYLHENARRDRVYGKHVPNTRVDTSDLADRVSTIAFLEMIQVPKFIERDRRLDSATLPELFLIKRTPALYKVQAILLRRAPDCLVDSLLLE
jgi:hypothetical protein